MRDLVVFPLTKDKTPALEGDWRNYKGSVTSKMQGIAIPSGLIVLDLDSYKGVTVEEVEDALGCSLDWDDAHLQTTLNGGEHYCFEVPSDIPMINGVNVLGVQNFDTRSAGKGYIATGEGYEDQTFIGVIEAMNEEGYFPKLPQLAVDRLSTLAGGSDVEDDDLMSMVSSQSLDMSDDEVDIYLSKLTSEHAQGDTWLRVMMGIYHQFGGSDDGWQRADAFSRLHPDSYNERKNRTRWESFGKRTPENPVTFASVIELVGGREAVADEKTLSLRERVVACSDKAELQTIIKEVAAARLDDINSLLINKDIVKVFKEITDTSVTLAQVNKMVAKCKPHESRSGDYVDDFVFMTSSGEYMNRTNKTVMGPRAFDVAMGRDTPLNEDGESVPATVYVRDRIDVVHMGMYAPHLMNNNDLFSYEGVDYVNTYVPTRLQRVKAGTTDIVERVKSHVAHILSDAREREIFINYLAHNVQYAGKKIPWAILLQGVEGDGKSFFAEMMKHVMGNQNSKSVGAESLDEKFTPWAEGSCLVFIEEVKMDNVRKHEVLNKLKPYITNPVVSVRKMRTDVYETINTTNYVAFTNFQDSLPIGDNDRRYAILFSRWQDKRELEAWMSKNPNYYQDLYADMRENAGEILDWLLTHKISDEFMGMSRAPDTDAKRKMVDLGRSDACLLVEDAIAEHECWDINNQVVNVTKLAALVHNGAMMDMDNSAKDFPKTSRIKHVMQELGYHNIGRYKDKNRKNNSIYAKNTNAKVTEFMEEDPDFVPF